MADKTNILLLITDAQRADAVGLEGSTQCRTPTFDRIAGEGAYFENLRCASPVCSPARAALFTGFDPHVVGMPHIPSATIETEKDNPNAARMGITRPSFTERLRRNGYHCYLAGKWHVGEHTVSDAFDTFVANDAYGLDYAAWCKEKGFPEGRLFNRPGDNPYRYHRPPGMSLPKSGVSDMPEGTDWDAWTVQQALDLLDQIDYQHPFMLTCCTRGPHSPYVVPPEYHDMYDPAAIPEPASFKPSETEPAFLKDSYFRAMWKDWGTDWSAWQKSWAVYWGYTTYMDSLFAKIVDRIEKAGVLENTLVIMCSDHGDMIGEHGLGHKFCPYEGNLQVPLAMRLPGVIKAGARVSMDIDQTDFAPTILSAVGVECDPTWPGANLLPYVNGEKPEPESRDVFSQFNLGPDWGFHKVRNWRLIVRRPWKYIYHEAYGGEMYNMEQDPSELRNLAGQESVKEVETQLREALFGWMSRTEDPLMQRIKSGKETT